MSETTNLSQLCQVYPINDLKETLIDLYQQWLTKYNIANVTVSRAYPRKAMPGGAILVVQRTAVNWRPTGLGQTVGETPDPGGTNMESIRATGLMESIEVSIWASNADLRDLLFVFCQGAVLEAMPDLIGKYAIHNLTMDHANDDEIDDQIIAETTWYRNVLKFSAYTELATVDLGLIATAITTQVSYLPPVYSVQP